MIRPWMKGVAIALCQLLLVASLAAKYEYDRATRPRLWVKTENRDPNMPVRGRYLCLTVAPETTGIFQEPALQPWVGPPGYPESLKGSRYESVYDAQRVHLEIRENQLVAVKDPRGSLEVSYWRDGEGRATTSLAEPLAFYLPQNAKDPTHLAKGDELWAEVTVPKQGPPRPIQLGVRKPDGTITPLTLR